MTDRSQSSKWDENKHFKPGLTRVNDLGLLSLSCYYTLVFIEFINHNRPKRDDKF